MSGSSCDTYGQANRSVFPVHSTSPDFGLVRYDKFRGREKLIVSSVSPGPGLVAIASKHNVWF